jgi:hypothetical protein
MPQRAAGRENAPAGQVRPANVYDNVPQVPTMEVVMLAVLFVAVFCFVPLALALVNVARRRPESRVPHQRT